MTETVVVRRTRGALCPHCLSDIVVIACPGCERALLVSPDDEVEEALNVHIAASPQCQAGMAAR